MLKQLYAGYFCKQLFAEYSYLTKSWALTRACAVAVLPPKTLLSNHALTLDSSELF